VTGRNRQPPRQNHGHNGQGDSNSEWILVRAQRIGAGQQHRHRHNGYYYDTVMKRNDHPGNDEKQQNANQQNQMAMPFCGAHNLLVCASVWMAVSMMKRTMGTRHSDRAGWFFSKPNRYGPRGYSRLF